MVENPYDSKKAFFMKGSTKSYDFRLKQLKKLKETIKKYEDEIIDAMNLDLGKPAFEAYTAEIAVVYEELNQAIKNLRSWMKPEKVKTPLHLKPAKSYVYPEPKGVVLIISPWNYPFQLSFSPLIGAIAAGNCIVLKPSHQAKHTEEIICKIIEETFNKDYISLVRGPGSQVVNNLIDSYRFDHIFFTGSVSVGKKIATLAAKDLTPITLELGGKSPVIVHRDADLDLAARRITWAKFYNAGQTCVAPDYLLVDESIKMELVDRIRYYIERYYGKYPSNSMDFARIVNEKRFNRLVELLEEGQIIEGGDFLKEEKYIAPTLIDSLGLDSPLMKEEIFGPILAIISYKDICEIEPIIEKNPYPLALYLFTKDRNIENHIIRSIQFGGGCINHLILHVANSHLPFGGFAYSGMGNYHSKYSFSTFSHEKPLYETRSSLDLNFLYPPYKPKILNLIRKFFSYYTILP